MKKKWILVTTSLLLLLAVTGCTKNTNDTDGQKSSVIEESQAKAAEVDLTAVDVPEDYTAPESLSELLEGYDISELVELGEYKGLELTKDIEEVTEDEINEAAKEAMKTTYVDVNRAAEAGDIVDIDYKAKVDGEKIDSETEDNYKLVLGSQTKIEGFEDGLIGKKAGDKVKLKLTFPRSYTTELSGKDVTYTVKINSVQVKSEEISEEWISENTDFDSVDDYKRDLRVKLEAKKEAAAEEAMKEAAWRKVLEDSVVKEYPKEVLTYGKYYYSHSIESYCKANDISLEAYLEEKGMTASDYEDRLNAYSQSMAGQLLVLAALEAAENISTSDAAYTERLEDILKEAETDEAGYFKSHSRFETEQSIMLERIYEILAENAVVIENMVAAEESEPSEVSEAGEAGLASGLPETTEDAAASQTEESKEAESSETEEPSLVKEVLEPIE